MVKISQISTEKTTLDGTELVELSDSLVTKRCTTQAIADLAITSGSSIERWDFAANSDTFPDNPYKIYIVKNDGINLIPDGTLMYSIENTLPTTPTIADFYFK
jgi:hypothetical protein